METFQIWQKTEKTTYNNNDVFAINDSEKANKFKKMKLSTIMSGKPMSDADKIAAGYLTTDEVYYDGYPNLQKGGLHAQGVVKGSNSVQVWRQYEDRRMTILLFLGPVSLYNASLYEVNITFAKTFTSFPFIGDQARLIPCTGVFYSYVAEKYSNHAIISWSCLEGAKTGILEDTKIYIEGGW